MGYLLQLLGAVVTIYGGGLLFTDRPITGLAVAVVGFLLLLGGVRLQNSRERS